MCVICKEWQSGKLTTQEALRNLGELMVSASLAGKAHYDDVVEEIMNKEVPMALVDEELDQKWHEETYDE